jgi:hypothetical protein
VPIKIRSIFLDHKLVSGLRKTTERCSQVFEIEEVEKMLQCGDPDKGFTTYRCPDCGNIQR